MSVGAHRHRAVFIIFIAVLLLVLFLRNMFSVDSSHGDSHLELFDAAVSNVASRPSAPTESSAQPRPKARASNGRDRLLNQGAKDGLMMSSAKMDRQSALTATERLTKHSDSGEAEEDDAFQRILRTWRAVLLLHGEEHEQLQRYLKRHPSEDKELFGKNEEKDDFIFSLHWEGLSGSLSATDDCRDALSMVTSTATKPQQGQQDIYDAAALSCMYQWLFPDYENLNRSTTSGNPQQQQRSATVAKNFFSSTITASINGRGGPSIIILERANQSKESPDCYYRLRVEDDSNDSSAPPVVGTNGPPPVDVVTPQQQSRSICIRDGQLVLREKKTQSHLPPSHSVTAATTATRSTPIGEPLRLCNELRRRVTFRYATDGAVTAPSKRGKGGGGRKQERESSMLADDEGETPTEVRSQKLHVVACWQFYGYHLWQCLASAWIVQLQHQMWQPGGVDLYLYNHAASLPAVSRHHFSHAMYLGDPRSFARPVLPSSLRSAGGGGGVEGGGGASYYRSSPMWKFWQQNTPLPSRVREVQRGPFLVKRSSSWIDQWPSTQYTCYSQGGLIGQPVHHSLTHRQRRFHALHLKLLVLLDEPVCVRQRDELSQFFLRMMRQQNVGRQQEGPEGPMRSMMLPRELSLSKLLDQCAAGIASQLSPSTPLAPSSSSSTKDAPFVLTIGVRKTGKTQGSRVILNLAAVVAHLQRVFPSSLFAVSVVDFAALPLAEQVAVAHRSDILLAAHGGGNLWVAMQKPRAVLIEIWALDYVPRNVFLSMAEQHHVKYLPLLGSREQGSRGGGGGGKNGGNSRAQSNFMHQNVVVQVAQLERLLREEVVPHLQKVRRVFVPTDHNL